MNPPDVFDWVHITERSCDGVVKWIKDDGSYVISTKEYGDLWVDLVELEPVESNEKGAEVLPVERLRGGRRVAAQAWLKMCGDLDRSIAELAGLLRIKQSEYRIAKSSELKAEKAFVSGKLHAYEETRAALDHYFPVYFYTFFDSVTGEPRTASVSGIDSEPTQETDAHE